MTVWTRFISNLTRHRDEAVMVSCMRRSMTVEQWSGILRKITSAHMLQFTHASGEHFLEVKIRAVGCVPRRCDIRVDSGGAIITRS